MIVSFRHKFVFAAVPKTGTHAVRRALRRHMGPQDLEQVGLFVQSRFPIPELARIGHGHLSLAQIRPYMTPQDFGGFFKFAFVRNPFDRFASYCSFVTRENAEFDEDPKKVMRHFLDHPPFQHVLFWPQHAFVTDERGDVLSDFVGRVEDMQTSYDEICERIGIPSAQLEKVNTSRKRDYRDYYDEALIEGVAKLYARDLELFGYDF